MAGERGSEREVCRDTSVFISTLLGPAPPLLPVTSVSDFIGISPGSKPLTPFASSITQTDILILNTICNIILFSQCYKL